MQLSRFITNSKSLLNLAYPILIAQLIQTMMGFVDTVMAGRVSATDMAAIAIASSVWMPIILTVHGLTMALTTIVAKHAGAKKYNDVVKATFQMAWGVTAFGIAVIGVYFIFKPLIYAHVDIEPQLKQLLFDYLHYIIWGAPGFFLYLVLRNYSEGLAHTKPTMIISIIALLINIPLNYIFIYGMFDIPAYGGAGCGIATAIVYWVMFIATLGYSVYAKCFKHVYLFSRFYWPNKNEIMQIFALGFPIALSLLFEVSLFMTVALILAPLGAEVVASHQIAINFSGLVFMIPLSLGMAVTIRVGNALGNKNLEQAKEICSYAIALGVIIACCTASLTLLFRHKIAAVYTLDENLITMAASLMFLAALFQFSDAIQVISSCALRGYQDTKAILYITFVAYWLFGLPIGILLGMTDIITPRMGAAGFWYGFIIGLTTAAILLSLRLKFIQTKKALHKNNTNNHNLHAV